MFGEAKHPRRREPDARLEVEVIALTSSGPSGWVGASVLGVLSSTTHGNGITVICSVVVHYSRWKAGLGVSYGSI